MDKTALQLLGKCKLIHIEPSARMKKALESVLHEDGIQDIRHLSSIEKATGQPPTVGTDIILIDFDDNPAQGVEFVQRLRLGELDADPFLVIVGTQTDTTVDLVRQEAAAGLDIIMKHPFSATDMIGHIGDLARKPRRFALSQVYVGPDRRGRPRIGTEGDAYVVPNRLKLRAADRLEPEAVEKWRSAWRGMVADMQARRPIMDRLPMEFFL